MKTLKNTILIMILLSTSFCQPLGSKVTEVNVVKHEDWELRDRLRHQGRQDRQRQRGRRLNRKDRSEKWKKFLHNRE